VPPKLHANIELPGLLSWLAFGDPAAPIKGISDFPADEVPPLWLTFVSFHNMVVLGVYFILVMAIATYKLWRNNLLDSPGFLRLLLFSIPLPLIACQLGWISAEVGRQPWIVYRLLRTSEAASITVGANEILFSLVLFGLIYLCLGVLYVYLFVRKVKQGPAPLAAKEVLA
jgi:cytochrome d ubiquinol oxidase subunit I